MSLAAEPLTSPDLAATDRAPGPTHERRTISLVLSSTAVFLGLSTTLVIARELDHPGRGALLAALVLAQALWLYRLYVVAHEGVHRKLFPRNPWLNDLVAALLLTPIGAPLSIYRKVHHFHHGANRRDVGHAALDHFKVGNDRGAAARLYFRLVWTFYVFGGGFFLHSLVTILIFLLVPTRLAVRIDPVFARWRPAARLRALGELLVAVGLHLAIATFLGSAIWWWMLGAPLLVFAWIWSLLLYIYHYGTSVGPDVRQNVRALPRQPFMSWLLLNFNEHVTHHDDPRIPWYQLPTHRRRLPAQWAGNENVSTLWQAIWQQRRGPVLCARPPKATKTVRG